VTAKTGEREAPTMESVLRIAPELHHHVELNRQYIDHIG